MRSVRLALGFVLLSAGCSGSIDGTPANTTDSGVLPSEGASETSVADPLADPTEDPTAGEEGQGDFDAGTEDTSAPEEAGVAVDAAPATDSGAKKSAASTLVSEAARELAAMKESTYSHTTNVVESTGTFDYDCSGFIDYALTRVLPAQLASLASAQGVSRPLAKHYEAFFASIPATGSKGGWTRVSHAIDLVPGDVVAWLKPADVVSTNTGHVLMVRGAVKVNPARPDEVLVPIYDSTSSPHGSTDSRAPSGEGLGTGTIGVLIDAKGAPVGYRWTGGISVKLEYTSVALGHLEG